MVVISQRFLLVIFWDLWYNCHIHIKFLFLEVYFDMELSQEQELFIEHALAGRDILVDACIGSGKTTAIQELCCRVGFFKQVLYLTYNKLLKLDARSRIRKPNVTVTNYHGYAYSYVGRGVGLSNLIQVFNQRKPAIPHVDLLILDEYQDLETEMSEMLLYIRDQNPQMQVVAVGDMQQKIYDKTRLDVLEFMQSFLRPDHLNLEFTQCFRLNEEYAFGLGQIWEKQIRGVNPNLLVRAMEFDELVSYLGGLERPGDLLVLGPNAGIRASLQNKLEELYPSFYNKRTLWSSITEGDSSGTTEPDEKAAVFCTYDKSKGMERKVCVICGWTESYWNLRMSKPNVSYEILRNVFLVAASRGKQEILFLKTEQDFLQADVLSKPRGFHVLEGMISISDMFSFKYRDDIRKAVDALELEVLEEPGELISIRTSDALVDLSPCVGIYQECSYFSDCDIDRYIETWFDTHQDGSYLRKDYSDMDFEHKVLYYTSIQCGQYRYQNQVELPLLTPGQKDQLYARLSIRLASSDRCQVGCEIPFCSGGVEEFCAVGYADAVKDGAVYELKFVSALQPEHYLQCASYMCGLGLEVGYVWNVHTGEFVQVSIPDRKRFLDCVACAVTKGSLTEFEDEDGILV